MNKLELPQTHRDLQCEKPGTLGMMDHVVFCLAFLLCWSILFLCLSFSLELGFPSEPPPVDIIYVGPYSNTIEFGSYTKKSN